MNAELSSNEVPIEIQKQFYRPVCNEDEINRILNVKDANDYLLKLRADTIVDHMRLFRVYRNYALANEGKWTLEKSFIRSHYDRFLERLEEDKKVTCSKITFGDVFSNEPNGQIFQTDFGPIITICESLRYFLSFMNLGFMDFGKEVPVHVRINSLIIGIRMMLQTEALDFLMDPRGIIPEDIEKEITKTIPYQMQFIAGHEFSHYLLGHISSNKLINKPIFKAFFSNQSDYCIQKAYSYSEKEELDADLKSFEFCNYDDSEKISMLECALIWFESLVLCEAAKNTISPSNDPKSHPPARDRSENLLKNVSLPKDYNYKKWDKFRSVVDVYKKNIIKDITLKIEKYETYGSMYLDEPNTKWRGKKLIDRVDYY